jgi:hypothetical protein
MKYLLRLIAVFTLSSGLIQQGVAQTSSGQISGRATDPTGAAVVNAHVILKNQLTGESRGAQTDGTGEFVFAAVQPGTFSVSVEATGFKMLEKQDLRLSASERLSAGNLQLQIGTRTDMVEVQADRTTIQTTSSERSALLDDKEIASLMTQGRDITALLRVLPGVVKDSGGDQLGTQNAGQINGVRGDSNSLSVDGTTGNSRGGANLDTPANEDSVGEVKVLLNNYQAEYGQAAGAIVEMVTKAGSRRFHGSAYYYNRNEAFNANDYFNKNQTYIPRPKYRYNTIGYNVGGPIFVPGLFNTNREKLFFFFSQEIWPTKSVGNLLRFTMPTALERTGNFSASVDRNGNAVYIADPVLIGQGLTCKKKGDSGCFPNSVIPASRIDADTQKLTNILPLPQAGVTGNFGSGLYNYITQPTIKKPVNQQVLRVDYNITAKLHTFFRGTHTTQSTDGPQAPAVNAAMQWGVPFFYSTPSRNASLNLTYIASPRLINELNVGFASWAETTGFSSSADITKFQKDKLGMTLGQFNPKINPLNLVPRASWAGSTGFALANSPSILFDNRFPLSDDTRSWQVQDSITRVWKGHNSKAGVYLQFGKYLQRHTGATFDGQFSFDTNNVNPTDTGYAYANSLLGTYNSYTEGSNTVDYAPNWKIAEWYLQDSWKILSRLTLDYGLRFTYDIPTTLKPGNGAGFVQSRYNSAKVPQLYQPYNDPAKGRSAIINPSVAGPPGTPSNPVQPAVFIGQFVPNSGDVANGVVINTDPSYPASLRNSNGLLVAPRVGFAYDLFGDGKTAIRGGAGLFYNTREGGGTVGDYSLIAPLVTNPVLNYGDARQFAAGCSGTACSGGIQLLSPQATRILQVNRPIESTLSTTLGVQRAIGYQMQVDIAYVGTFGRHLSQQIDYNKVPYLSHFQSQNLDQTLITKPTTVLGNIKQYTPLNDNFFRPLPGFTNVNLRQYSGTSNYHSLQTNITRRFAKGLKFGVVYTWSKAMTDQDTVSGSVATYQPRRFWDYGEASFDRTNNFVVHWTWDVPSGSTLWRNFATKTLLDNWQISGIGQLVSGAPLASPTQSPHSGNSTLTTGAIDLTGGGDGARAVVNANPVLAKDKRTVSQFFNTSAFVLPTYGQIPGPNTPGITRVNFGRGPGTNRFDTALSKNFPLKEGILVQIRGEAYNVFNHPSFTKVDTTAVFDQNTGLQKSATFGNLTADDQPRILQLSGRVNF